MLVVVDDLERVYKSRDELCTEYVVTEYKLFANLPISSLVARNMELGTEEKLKDVEKAKEKLLASWSLSLSL